MYKNIKKAIIALAAVLMMVSGGVIVESAELVEAHGYVEITPFVSGCWHEVTASGGISVFTNATGNVSSGRLAHGALFWLNHPASVVNGRFRISTGRYVNQNGTRVASCG